MSFAISALVGLLIAFFGSRLNASTEDLVKQDANTTFAKEVKNNLN